MNYNKFPETKIVGYDHQAYSKEQIVPELRRHQDKKMIVVECYPGVENEALDLMIEVFQPERIILSQDIFYENKILNFLMAPYLTEDRVRGTMCYGKMEDFVDQKKLKAIQESLDLQQRTLIYGVGASLIPMGDLLIYGDMARWEIQLRYRRGMPNVYQHNEDEDSLKKIKRGFFVEWRLADKRKMSIFEDIDYLLDTNTAQDPKMITGVALREGLKQMTTQPFRLVPYFDPGVWGGQWMKEVCGLDPQEKNYAWSFDGVPEENSLYLRYGDVRIEIPCMDLTLYQPKAFLGQKNFSRFGAEFPIRFDFLDTIDGQNLSLQVHPLTEYIKSHYGMTYTQDESYYILDCKEGGGVYLGLKENVDQEAMFNDLREANQGKKSFDALKYVNFFEAKKHDHFLIPAGTIHCSSSNCMVLEISATPYIFTFKLWDWDRLGLDGLPRPIHIQEGEENIQWDRDTSWVKENLINHIEIKHEGDDYLEEKTGLHPLEFIETRRFTTHQKTYHHPEGEFNMLNLVEGSEAVIESVDGRFAPYTVHYAETFIIPAGAGDYTISPLHDETIKFIKAYVRHSA